MPWSVTRRAPTSSTGICMTPFLKGSLMSHDLQEAKTCQHLLARPDRARRSSAVTPHSLRGRACVCPTTGDVSGLTFSPTHLILAAVGRSEAAGHVRLWCAAGPDATWRPLAAWPGPVIIHPKKASNLRRSQNTFHRASGFVRHRIFIDVGADRRYLRITPLVENSTINPGLLISP